MIRPVHLKSVHFGQKLVNFTFFIAAVEININILFSAWTFLQSVYFYLVKTVLHAL